MDETSSKRKIAIVGTAISSRNLVPVHDPSWEMWVCSLANDKTVNRIDQWFELHDLADLTGEKWRWWAAPYLAYLSKVPFKVWMQVKNPAVPNAEVFPKDELVAAFPDGHFTSSVAWMLAKAIYEGVDTIGLWGVDMSAGHEYEYERPGVQYWLSIARDRGIKVYIPTESDLGYKIPLYGYGDAEPIARKLKAYSYELRDKINETDQEILDYQRKIEVLARKKYHLEGCLENVIYTRRTFFAWSGPDA